MYLKNIKMTDSDMTRFGVLALLIHYESNNETVTSRGLTKSPWMIVDTDDDAKTRPESPVKFFYIINSFFDG